MDALIAILSVVAGVLAVVGGALPLIAYRKERKKPPDDNPSKNTDKPNRSGPSVGSGTDA